MAGGAAGIAKAVNDAKAAQRQLTEAQRHNKTMEAIAMGKGLFLKPYKRGYGLHLKPYFGGKGLKKKNFDQLKIPNRALTNVDIAKYAKILKIPHFRGVFMRNDLPKNGPYFQESAVINLDDKNNMGTHWVAYKKHGDNVIYFDSFGNLRPPLDLILYLGVDGIKYNQEKYQDYNTYNCGHLCLQFLSNNLTNPI